MGLRVTIRVGSVFISVEDTGDGVVVEQIPPLEPPPEPPVERAAAVEQAIAKLPKGRKDFEVVWSDFSAIDHSSCSVESFRVVAREALGLKRISDARLQAIIEDGASYGLWHREVVDGVGFVTKGQPPKTYNPLPGEPVPRRHPAMVVEDLKLELEAVMHEKGMQKSGIDVEMASIMDRAGLEEPSETRPDGGTTEQLELAVELLTARLEEVRRM